MYKRNKKFFCQCQTCSIEILEYFLPFGTKSKRNTRFTWFKCLPWSLFDLFFRFQISDWTHWHWTLKFIMYKGPIIREEIDEVKPSYLMSYEKKLNLGVYKQNIFVFYCCCYCLYLFCIYLKILYRYYNRVLNIL